MKKRKLGEFLQNSYSDNQKQQIHGYERDKKLSGKRVQVYHKDGHAIIVHRGTKGIHDVGTDAAYISTGYKSKRFKHSKKIQKQAEKKYKKTTTVGHSLGGTLAETSAIKRGKSNKVITYNKIAIPLRDKPKALQRDIRTKNDFASIGAHRKTEVLNTTTKGLAAHSIDNLFG